MITAWISPGSRERLWKSVACSGLLTTIYGEVKSTVKAPFAVDRELEGEIGVCIVDGYIEACGEKVEKGSMLVSKEEDICRLVIGENSHLLVFGGKPFEEERLFIGILWLQRRNGLSRLNNAGPTDNLTWFQEKKAM